MSRYAKLMWIQYRAGIKFARFSDEPEFPHEGSLEGYQSFVLRFYYV